MDQNESKLVKMDQNGSKWISYYLLLILNGSNVEEEDKVEVLEELVVKEFGWLPLMWTLVVDGWWFVVDKVGVEPEMEINQNGSKWIR